MLTIKCKRIYQEDHISDGFLVIHGSKINKITNAKMKYDLDYSKYRIIPGIFDTHNHGTMGYGMMGNLSDPQAEIRGYVKALAAQGVTMIFPTADLSMMGEIAKFTKSDYVGAKIMGIHSEGPYLNRVGEKGSPIPYPTIDMDKMQKAIHESEGLLRLFAIAPEIPGSLEVMEFMREHQVKLAIAHSDCNAQQTREAIKNGIQVATHLGNVMTGIHHRDVGVLGECLLNEQVDCELICDGMHICLDMVELILRAKDNRRIMMISDCSQFSGAPRGEYRSFFPGSNLYVHEDGFVKSGEGRICGSSKPVLYGIQNLVEKLHIPLEDVVKMSSLNACRVYGFDQKKGSIRVSKDADFVVIDDDYQVVATYVEGIKVYDRESDHDLFNERFLEENKIENS